MMFSMVWGIPTRTTALSTRTNFPHPLIHHTQSKLVAHRAGLEQLCPPCVPSKRRDNSLWPHQSMDLSFVVGRSVTASAVDHNHAISGIHSYRNGEDIFDLALERCLSCPSRRNPVH